ncbi:NAD(P)H-hydrate epimerase [Marinobacter daqiaonensis]|uniref:Bifunctional NAD(P)H-hydrate repair enzyme n=1 Tax=Marinobacter daqiaonensis TaxID=650891 RepID=A0A1I6HDJ5_9GAMM|nr:NAD(P)H-hydrate dehydratase [Marinobacter daqiaonensis]SFR52552.1 NAD(P)H-hydrate epimerase [Marinobacter daqiaonensis]
MLTDNILSESLFTAGGVQALDRYLIDEVGVDGYVLMQKAARAAFRQLARHWPEAKQVLVLCASGNNGGDGYLVALNALRHGHRVDCVAVKDPGKLSGDARKAWQDAVDAGVQVRQWEDLSDSQKDDLFSGEGVIVDAMLGTGVRGKPRPPVDELVRRINRSAMPVLAVDVPSGLDAATGAAEGEAVQARVTATFIGQKIGLLTGQGPQYAGRVEFDTLGVGDDLAGCEEPPVAGLATWSRIKASLPAVSRVAHKGAFGHVLIIAGSQGFGGAGLLAAEAAGRSGAGLVSLATHPDHVAPALARCPSVMVRGVTHGNQLSELLERADAVVCGPGIGQSAWGQQMLQQVLSTNIPRVLDADALNLLAQQKPVVAEKQVITPHPGEAARLLDCSVADIEADRLEAVTRLQRRYGGVALLKGAGTLIAGEEGLPVLVAGANPGMATGGMGDVLSGICGALAALTVKSPELSLRDATTLAAAVHIESANRASLVRGYRSLLPVDVIDALSWAFRSAEQPVYGSWADE